ncbi:MAG: hypothetical protein IKF38_02405 [Clostridia bacterium]|nr:hypothetical protein [Clostridia bacterium]
MNKENKNNVEKKHKKMDAGQIFVKVMAGILAIFMVAGTAISLIFALIQG